MLNSIMIFNIHKYIRTTSISRYVFVYIINKRRRKIICKTIFFVRIFHDWIIELHIFFYQFAFPKLNKRMDRQINFSQRIESLELISNRTQFSHCSTPLRLDKPLQTLDSKKDVSIYIYIMRTITTCNIQSYMVLIIIVYKIRKEEE